MYSLVDRPVAGLPNSGRFILWAMRGWRYCQANHFDPKDRLSGAFEAMHASDALEPFDEAMAGFDDIGYLDVAPMPQGMISEEEAVLLSLWKSLFSDERDRVFSTLGLLSRDDESLAAIEFALRQATSAFQKAGLHFQIPATPSIANGGKA